MHCFKQLNLWGVQGGGDQEEEGTDGDSKKKADGSCLLREQPAKSHDHGAHSFPDISLPAPLVHRNTVLQAPCCPSADQAR